MGMANTIKQWQKRYTNTMQQPISVLGIQAVREHVNVLLGQHFREREAQAKAINPDYARLWQTIHTTALAGGKRLRPYLTYLSYTIAGGNDEALAIRVGTTLELLHLCMLVHDDIIDRDYIRHGQPNVAGIYRKHYASNLSEPAEVDHFSNAAALVAGDLLLSDTYRFLIDTALPVDTLKPIFQLLDAATFSVAGGQLLDTEAPMRPIQNFDSLTVAEYKTAIYSCVTPLAVGATLAQAAPAYVGQLKEVGKNLGIAFQLADDLLGVFGDEQQTGKSNLGDLREAKRTFLLCNTYELATSEQQQTITGILENHREDPKELARIKQIMISCGARTATEDLANDYLTKAKKITAQLAQASPDITLLDDFMDSLVKRSS